MRNSQESVKYSSITLLGATTKNKRYCLANLYILHYCTGIFYFLKINKKVILQIYICTPPPFPKSTLKQSNINWNIEQKLSNDNYWKCNKFIYLKPFPI